MFLKSIFYPVLIVFSWLISPITIAGEKVDQLLEVSSGGKLFIDVTRGMIQVKGWDKSQISLQGELDDSVKQLIFKNKGNKTLIKAVSKGEKHWGDSNVLKVYMPHHSKLYFKGVDSTFKLSSLREGVEGKTISGDILVEKVKNRIALSSMGGDIKLNDSSGEIKLESVAGDIIVDGHYRKAHIRSMSGSIMLDISEVDDVKAKTVSGELKAKGEIKDNAKVVLASVSGDILYRTLGELDAACEISSQFGGEITNKLTKDKVEKSQMNGKALNFVSGDGSGSLVMQTITGNVTIAKGM